MAATIYLPDAIRTNAVVLFCFPGGGYSRSYFDLPEDGYSQAAHHAAQGMIVVAIDHLAVGQSSLPVDEYLAYPPGDNGVPRFKPTGPFTLQSMAAGCDAAVHAVMRRLCDGTLLPGIPALSIGAVIGLGQSMGGHIAVMAQANHGTFDAVVALGSSFTQTRLALKSGLRYPLRNAPVESLLAAASRNSDREATFHWPDTPISLVAADMSVSKSAPWLGRAVPRCAADLQLPAVLAKEAGSVRVPVFLGYGEIDVTLEPTADVAMFRSSCDIRLAIVPHMAHMHNFASSRAKLWRKIDFFVDEMVCEGSGRWSE